MKIYKYPLAITNAQLMYLPEDHKILSVQVQDGQVMMWALVDDERYSDTKYLIEFFGTGHEVDTEGTFIGTVQLSGFVWHVFGGEQ